MECLPITVAARSKARSNAGIVGSNPTKSMDICLVCVYCVFVLSCVQVEALRRADPPSKESYQLCLFIPLLFLGNGSVKTFPRQRVIGGVVFCAVRVVSQESSCSQNFLLCFLCFFFKSFLV
jgi:hypothetical protein